MKRIGMEEAIHYVDEDGAVLAKVEFPVSNGVADITHTFVDGSLRGQGMAAKLMEEATEQIRNAGLKAKPTCSYAQKWFQQNPENFDLLYWSCDCNRTD